MTRPFFLAAAVLTGLLVSHSAAQTLAFRLLVLDALNGEPQSGVRVEYFCEGEGFRGDSINTASDGKAEIPSKCKCKNGTRIEISELPPGNKEECGGVDALTIGEILTKGFISEPTGAGNIWCPNKQRRRLRAVPGQVTVFVKKPTWWQAHVAG